MFFGNILNEVYLTSQREDFFLLILAILNIEIINVKPTEIAKEVGKHPVLENADGPLLVA